MSKKLLTVKINGTEASDIFKLLDIIGRHYVVSDMSPLKHGDYEEKIVYVDLERKEAEN